MLNAVLKVQKITLDSIENFSIWRVAFSKLIFMQKWLSMDFTFEPPHDKTNKMTVRPAKTLISLGIRPVWSESSLCTQWVAKDPSFLHADSEDSDQTGRMPRLIYMSLRWAHKPFCWFCHEVAHFLRVLREACAEPSNTEFTVKLLIVQTLLTVWTPKLLLDVNFKFFLIVWIVT